jgi:hypothetical protein
MGLPVPPHSANTSPSSGSGGPGLHALLRAAGERALQAGVFASVEVRPDGVVCGAMSPSAPAEYRLYAEGKGGGRLWVGFFTADRWLSHSIEADLLHTGDKLGQLIGEELVELGVEPGDARLDEPEHFRDDAKRFTFRSWVPVAAEEWGTPAGAALAGTYLLAYEAALRHLGDVDTRED